MQRTPLANLPSYRRLRCIRCESRRTVVHYERGRIAHTFYTLVAKLAKDEAKLAWSAVGLPFKDYAAFLDALRTGKLAIAWITPNKQRLQNVHECHSAEAKNL